MTTASELVTYRQEVFRFLHSVSIKFTPIATAHNVALEAAGVAVDRTDPTTWKYYRNLAGEYHPSDTVMTVVSLDTKEEVPFTKETLARHSKTAAAYRPGRAEWDALIERYPAQADLIKSIVYPVADIPTAVAAEDFTILAYGRGLLEESEEDFVVQELKRFLAFIGRRWYMDWLGYEAYFYAAFWGTLWYLLAAAVFTARIKAMHTPFAHSFHIWEHLRSHGLGDYRDVLTRRQAHMLYRNIRYILANRGRQSNLTLLVDELLEEAKVGLVGKTIYQQTRDSAATCQWVPELISEPVPTRYAGSVDLPTLEDISTMTHRLYAMGAETSIDTEHIQRVTDRLSATRLNTMPTKLVEIRPLPFDRQYAGVLANFLTDTLVRLIEDGRYTPVIDLADPVALTSHQLTAKDALLLLGFAAAKARGETMVTLPTRYTPVATYKYAIDPAAWPKTLPFPDGDYPVAAFVDVTAFAAGVAYPLAPLITPEEFALTAGELFTALVRQLAQSRAEGSTRGSHAIQTVFGWMTDQVTHPLTLAPEATVADWLARPGRDLRPLVAAYDARPDARQRYAALVDTLLQKLIAFKASPVLMRYSDSPDADVFFKRLKDLFIQLCSYNVLFLDTERDQEHWHFFPKIGLDRLATLTERFCGVLSPSPALLASREHTREIDTPPTPVRIAKSTEAEVPFVRAAPVRLTVQPEIERTVVLPTDITVVQPQARERERGTFLVTSGIGITVTSEPA